MLNITADELDELRLKLLASVACNSWPEATLRGDAEQHAIEAAEHLGHLSAYLDSARQSFVPVDVDSIAAQLSRMVKERYAA